MPAKAGVSIVMLPSSWQILRVEITVTKPIQQFIERQLARGYTDVSEVARQAFLRWMAEEEEGVGEPPRLREKLDAAREGSFRLYDPVRYDSLSAKLDETSR